MNLLRGAGDIVRGAGFLAARPKLWGWLIAPAICAVLLLAALAWGVGALVDPVVVAIADLLPASVEAAAAAILRIAVIILLGLGALSIYVSVVALVAAPFNEFLSEAIEEIVRGVPGESFSISRFTGDVVRGIGHATRRVTSYVFKMTALFALSFVPVIGPFLYLAGGAWVTAEFAAYDAYDAVWARKRLRYREKMAAMRARRGRALGLGAVVALLFLVPIANLFALSLGAAAATLASLESEARP